MSFGVNCLYAIYDINIFASKLNHIKLWDFRNVGGRVDGKMWKIHEKLKNNYY